MPANPVAERGIALSRPPDLPAFFVSRRELQTVRLALVERPAASLAPLTLHGPPGAGKTSLAAALAQDGSIRHSFPDGVLWASLGEHGSVELVHVQWAEALGEALPPLPDAAARAAELRTRLRDSRTLLIVDDVAHLDQIEALNVGGPNCARIITTASEEVAYGFKTLRHTVARLTEDAALEMLTRWAGMLAEVYVPTVREIVRRLCYSPLLLALIGAQARQGITWLRLLELLADAQGPLATLDIDAAETRSHALDIVMNLVMTRFGAAQLERATLLAAFVPGTAAPFSARAAGACWDVAPQEAHPRLEGLAQAALIAPLAGDRYALHPALHAYLQRAAAPDALAGAVDRLHADYQALVEAPTTDVTEIDGQYVQIMATYRARAAADMASGGFFTDGLMNYYEARGLWESLAMLAGEAVRAADDDRDAIREATYLADQGYAQSIMGRLREAERSFRRALAISRELGDPTGEATALNNLGAIYERQGRIDEALLHYQQSLALREALGVPEDVAATLNNVAGVLYWNEEWDDALTAFQRVLDMATTLGDRAGQAQAWLNIGATCEQIGRADEAEQAYQRTLAIYANLEDAAGQAQVLNNLGIVYYNLGENRRALQHFQQSLQIKEALGDRPGQASTLNNIALLYEKTGAPAEALAYFERSHAILDLLDDPRAQIVAENVAVLREALAEAAADPAGNARGDSLRPGTPPAVA